MADTLVIASGGKRARPFESHCIMNEFRRFSSDDWGPPNRHQGIRRTQGDLEVKVTDSGSATLPVDSNILWVKQKGLRRQSIGESSPCLRAEKIA